MADICSSRRDGFAAPAVEHSRLALLTDLYQLTMAFGYWRTGLGERESVFHLSYRRNPFGSRFVLAAGLATAIEFVESFRFVGSDLDYLASLTGNNSRPLFSRDFLDYLAGLRLTCDIDAMPEGTVAFPHEPLVRVRGPLIQAQLLESALLNIINFQSLIATKASRIVYAAGRNPVLEFGLRRAQGIDGALSASRAAYLGGCAATSNVLAGHLFDIPVRGTHAHSWVLCFSDEIEAFQAYADAMPNNCVLLVDTYDSIEGVRHAIQVAHRLRRRGDELLGIRLDSGDLASLSKTARRMLDEAGLSNVAILASNELDEHRIAQLRAEGAPISAWGVGTRLATAFDDPALTGVYKLSAIRTSEGVWEYKLKLSDEPAKASMPGILQVRRFVTNRRAIADVIYDTEGSDPLSASFGPQTPDFIPPTAEFADLLCPMLRSGIRAAPLPSLEDSRRRAAEQLAALPIGVTKLVDPDEYFVGIDPALRAIVTRLSDSERSRS